MLISVLKSASLSIYFNTLWWRNSV